MGLPLRMENLHAPTVPSGPTSGPVANGTQSSGLTLAQLQAKKDKYKGQDKVREKSEMREKYTEET